MIVFAKQYGFFPAKDGIFGRVYVRQVIYRYLDYGIPHNGFACVTCEECNHECLWAF